MMDYRSASAALALCLMIGVSSVRGQTPPAEPPAPPSNLSVTDVPFDNGEALKVSFQLSPDDVEKAKPTKVVTYSIRRSVEADGLYIEAADVAPGPDNYESGVIAVTVDKLHRNHPYYVRVVAIGPGHVESAPLQSAEPAAPTRQYFAKLWFGLIAFVICAAVVIYINLARKGRELKIRKIAGLEAVDEAVGRATEMGRPCLFVPGIMDMNDIQTVAGVTILSRVARVAAEYDAKVEVPTSRALVMTTCRETVQSAYLAAGRPDAYNEDNIYYVTDEQFGFVAYMSGMMVREEPAACFYMGTFYAESLILAETGNQVGAIQVAGTAMPAQLPFFVAACDYTLIGEEFFAASAYLSGEPDQLGSLKGQDVGKIIVAVLLVVGCTLATLAAGDGVVAKTVGLPENAAIFVDHAVTYLKDTMLK